MASLKLNFKENLKQNLKQSLKQSLKQVLTDRQHKLYAKEVAVQNLTYDSWIREQEKIIDIDKYILEKNGKCLTNDLQQVLFGSCQNENEGNYSKSVKLCQSIEAFDLNCQNDSILFLSIYEGEISKPAYGMICSQFASNESTILIYGDEDTLEGNARENPWFKPDWSPDRFLSCFYFGGLVVVRKSALKSAWLSCREKGIFESLGGQGDKQDSRQNNRQNNRQNSRQGSIEKLYLLLFEMLKMHHAFAKGHESSRMPVLHIPQVLYHSRGNGYEQIKAYRLPEAAAETPEAAAEEIEGPVTPGLRLSIIIPSKDNPDVLFHCLDSLLERTKAGYIFEILLVDNGSGEENRRRITEKVNALNQRQAQGREPEAGFGGVKYLYEPMPFNFSRMCNLGAADAEGQVLLFLNDDMEILQPDWMDLMMEKALLPYAGAVGAKLLYPESDRIQHAGITNLRVGPAHKLQFLSDQQVHYFGMNRGVHNMLAVTGACLMVKSEVFHQAGGFYEGLAVAFNDVDLCYTIYEQGYYNIVRNDVTFYHHESLSRGKDGESREKQLRLLKEKDLLYERHQELYGRDPFYHPYLTTDMLESEYTPIYHYQVTLSMPWSKAEAIGSQVKKAREDKCLVVGMECAMDLYKWQYGVSPEKGRIKAKPEEMGYYFQGYSFVIGADNACYKKKLLLKNSENKQIWAIPVEDRYRQDIKNNLSDQLNVDLTGFAAKLRREEIPAGVYQFGMLAEDRCSRQKLVNWSSWALEVPAQD